MKEKKRFVSMLHLVRAYKGISQKEHPKEKAENFGKKHRKTREWKRRIAKPYL